ncbi:iron ABC transporter permease [Marinomonas sp. SBI22]|uniref:ABC transporter permease n=1 Tax=unclassified Marinomonas TaxID=196814 RepID=UPI0005FA4E63|nr:iron ABC transporter permease [Marinomonas sp. S3726]KZM42945.1 iron ABC transporter permease [Marinomonas sp. SBI22]KZM44515.1 iron ABC transporter permease [Marinomonas sp. SBI8L]
MLDLAKRMTLFRPNWLMLISVAVALLLALPVLVILTNVLTGQANVWQHLIDTVLTDYISSSLLLMLGVGAGSLLLGVPTAWLTSVCRFPGHKWLAWALLLPLAVPAYIIAYTYTGLLDFAGPVQTLIRDLTGLSYGEYWFFEVRSLPGAIVMLSLVLYPYVYLMSRAAFLEQSANTLEVSRSLGYSHTRSFFKLALPLARPAIVAGVTLALMETLADYGTVKYFGVASFTTGIMRTFNGFGDAAAASQLASVLLLFVTCLILLERYSRRRISYHSSGIRKASNRKIELNKKQGVLAALVCFLPVFLGFIVPGLQLTYWAIFSSEGIDSSFIQLAWNSLYLAALAALIAVVLALILAYASRLNKRKAVQASVTVAGLGYALPGTIIAIGIIIPFAWLDHKIIAWVQEVFEVRFGLILSGTLFALLFAYTVRFMAVSLGAVQSGLGKITPSLDAAGRSLGYKPMDVLRKIHLPLMKSSVLTALLIVFVDVLKELPATLILRPFNFNTLAVRAFELASDERLADAAPASLMIVLVGLVPVILLSRSIGSGQAH